VLIIPQDTAKEVGQQPQIHGSSLESMVEVGARGCVSVVGVGPPGVVAQLLGVGGQGTTGLREPGTYGDGGVVNLGSRGNLKVHLDS
jgi:hypothetical protein